MDKVLQRVEKTTIKESNLDMNPDPIANPSKSEEKILGD